MTVHRAAARTPVEHHVRLVPEAYAPGICNIGPDEIAMRRRASHIGAIATLALLAVLLAIHAAPPWRLAIAVPAAGTAITYLQAILRFCVAFGWEGVFNFGRVGTITRVTDPAALLADRQRALRMIGAGCIVGFAIGLLAVLA